MTEAPQSNRPTPRTTAAIEAELRRQIRVDMAQAREDSDGELDDASLASIIARAIGMALGWHLEAPEHSRNASLSSRTWRPAGGPRGARTQEFESRSFDDRGPRRFDDRNAPPRRGPRDDDRDSPPRRGPRDDDRDAPPRRPRDDDRDFQPRRPRDDDRDFQPRRGPRDDDRDSPPRRGPQRPPFSPRGGSRPPNRPSGGGGFGPRRPPPRGR